MESGGTVRGLGMRKCYSNDFLGMVRKDYSDDGVCAFKSDVSVL